jgi:hypothetical protein
MTGMLLSLFYFIFYSLHLNVIHFFYRLLLTAAIEKLSSKLFLLAIIYRQKKRKISLTELFIGEVERAAI